MKGIALGIILTLTLSACMTASTVVQKHAKPLADKYCALSPEARAIIRQQLEADLAPHKLVMVCGDSE